MLPIRLVVLAAALALAPACAVAQSGPPPPAYGDYQETPAPDDYDAALSPHGMWAHDAQYGRIWRPAVAVGWQPYVDGYWAWSPYGWTWVSYEPWAWTFHYGRWAYVPAFGWSWIPGYVWGPAWVDWYWGDGFVGWAPLSPFGVHVTSFNHFIFVREHDFCSRRLHRAVYDHRRLPRHFVRDWRRRDSRSPDRHRIERVSRHPIVRVDHKPPRNVVPRGGGHPGRLARPDAQPRLGGARDDVRGVRRGFDRHESTRSTTPAVGERAPRLARPRVENHSRPAPAPPRGTGGWSRPRTRQPVAPQAPRAGGGARGWSRPAPPAVPGGDVGMPAPGLLGARRGGHAFAPGAGGRGEGRREGSAPQGRVHQPGGAHGMVGGHRP
jgi:hypothetical protein